jgi:hypothetical protein
LVKVRDVRIRWADPDADILELDATVGSEDGLE